MGQPGTTIVRGGEGTERSINLGINLGEKLPVKKQTRSLLSFSLNSNKTENGKGRDLRDTWSIGKGLIVAVVANGKRRVSWDKSKGGKTSFKWVIRAATKQNEKLSIGLGPKQSIAHCESNLSLLSTSPCILEARECSNTLLGPLSSTFNLDEIGETPTVFTTGLVTLVDMSRSDDDEGSLSVN